MVDLATAPYAAFLLRLCLGITFIAYALLNGVYTLRTTIAFFRSVGLPRWFVIITVELVGGACLILGIVPRYVALLLTPEIVGTIVKVHGKKRMVVQQQGWRVGVSGILGVGTVCAVSARRRRFDPGGITASVHLSRIERPEDGTSALLRVGKIMYGGKNGSNLATTREARQAYRAK
jgi:uncharacterized membrane protein YphA (DoxX/SURF4 family)